MMNKIRGISQLNIAILMYSSHKKFDAWKVNTWSKLIEIIIITCTVYGYKR